MSNDARTRAAPERRRHERTDCEGVVATYWKPSIWSSLFGPNTVGRRELPVLNISRGGMCFLSHERLKPGTRLQVAVRFGPSGPGFTAPATVVRQGPGAGEYPVSIGVQFGLLSPRAWDMLSTWFCRRVGSVLGVVKQSDGQ